MARCLLFLTPSRNRDKTMILKVHDESISDKVSTMNHFQIRVKL